MKCDYETIYKEFKELYPELIRRGISFSPYGYMAIEIRIPSVGMFKYDYTDGQLECIEEWISPKEIKQMEKEQRPDMYDNFCRTINSYLREHRVTHQQFADMVDISRMSLSKYLNGTSIPKVSTMRRICKQINVDL